MVLGSAWLFGGSTILVMEVKMKGLGGVDVVNADIVLFDPAGIVALGSSEMMECVVVNVILGALVVEINLFLTMELARLIVLLLRSKDLQFECGFLGLSLGSFFVGNFKILSGSIYLELSLLSFSCP